jgi:imidazolonepropionase-like amidohydrolase
MTDIGFSPEEALISATSGAARVLGIKEETGTIEEGKSADLVMVKGNPLNDIHLLTDPENIRVVVAAGRLVRTPDAIE